MTPVVFLDDSAVSPALVREVVIASSLDTLLYHGIIRFSDEYRTLTAQLQLGASISIAYVTESENSSDRRQNAQLVSFRIAAVESLTPEKGSPLSFAETVCTIVSPWFYQQIRRSQALFGSVSSIMRQVLPQEAGIDWPRSIRLIENSNDLAIARYRSYETATEFLSRLQMYPIANGSPMYMIGHFDKTVQLISKRSITGATPVATLTAFADPGEIDSSQGSQSIAVYMNLYTKSANNDKSAVPKAIITKDLLPPGSSPNLPSSVLDPTIATTGSLENKLPSGYVSSTQVFRWDVSPYEAPALNINFNQRKAEELQSAVALLPGVHPITSSLKPGASLLGRFGDSTNWGDGAYFIRKVEHMYVKQAYATKLHIVRFK